MPKALFSFEQFGDAGISEELCPKRTSNDANQQRLSWSRSFLDFKGFKSLGTSKGKGKPNDS